MGTVPVPQYFTLVVCLHVHILLFYHGFLVPQIPWVPGSTKYVFAPSCQTPNFSLCERHYPYHILMSSVHVPAATEYTLGKILETFGEVQLTVARVNPCLDDAHL